MSRQQLARVLTFFQAIVLVALLVDTTVHLGPARLTVFETTLVVSLSSVALTLVALGVYLALTGSETRGATFLGLVAACSGVAFAASLQLTDSHPFMREAVLAAACWLGLPAALRFARAFPSVVPPSRLARSQLTGLPKFPTGQWPPLKSKHIDFNVLGVLTPRRLRLVELTGLLGMVGGLLPPVQPIAVNAGIIAFLAVGGAITSDTMMAKYSVVSPTERIHIFWLVLGVTGGLALSLTVPILILVGIGIIPGVAGFMEQMFVQRVVPERLNAPQISQIYVVAMAPGAVFGAACAAVGTLWTGGLGRAAQLRRTTVVSGVSVVAVIVFASVEAVAEAIIGVLGGPESQIPTALAGITAAVTLLPLQRKGQRLVDRWLSRSLPAPIMEPVAQTRQAILFVDLVGYSELTASDEEVGVTAALILKRAAYQAAASGGTQVVKLMGDGVLVTSSTVAPLLDTVAYLEDAFARAADAVGINLAIRAGLHCGQVIVDHDGDVLGDAVNVAFRLESAGTARSVTLSEDAALEAGLSLEGSRELQLKGFAAPIRAVDILMTLPTSTRG